MTGFLLGGWLQVAAAILVYRNRMCPEHAAHCMPNASAEVTGYAVWVRMRKRVKHVTEGKEEHREEQQLAWSQLVVRTCQAPWSDNHTMASCSWGHA